MSSHTPGPPLVLSSHTRSLALGFSKPAVKRTIKVELFPATLKRCGKELNVDDAL
jgi:hypothetical protein